MAAYNGERYVGEMIESILSQTHHDLRIRILDDASTDGTFERLDRYARDDERIVLLRNRRNMGVVSTFERLLKEVEEPFFCLADQDDVWLPEKIENNWNVSRDTGAAAVYSDARVVDRELDTIAESMWELTRIRPIEGCRAFPLLLRNPATGCTVLGRSHIIPHLLPFPTRIPMHDWWLITRAAGLGGVAYLQSATVLYRQHGENTLGAAGSGIRGLAARRSRRQLSIALYGGSRMERRQALAVALLTRKEDRAIRRFLQLSRLPWWRRVLTSPVYAWLLLTEGADLGWRGVLYELAWYLFPYSAPPSHADARDT